MFRVEQMTGPQIPHGESVDLVPASELSRVSAELEAARALCADARRAMSLWGSQEDGVPDWPNESVNPFAVYQRLAALAPAAPEGGNADGPA